MREGSSSAGRPEPEPEDDLDPGSEVRSEVDADPETWRTEIRVTRWQAGDEVAFGELYERFEPLLEQRIRLHAFWAILSSRYQLRDVVQETWLAVHRSRGNFVHAGRGAFIAWVGRIADNTLIELLRRKNARKRGDGEEGEPLGEHCVHQAVVKPGLPAAETPTSSARVAEIHELAREALTDREYTAWELVEMRGYSPAEAGLALDESSGSAVRGLLKRARRKMVLRLTEEKGD
jgi:RNA polymerase sigma factor (sigma-70 family)